MSTGTKIIERALEAIGAHSAVSPASSGSIILGMEQLNSMLEMWLSNDIAIGFTPLEDPAKELNEAADTRNGIISNLAVQLAPFFDNGKVVVSPALQRNAAVSYNRIASLYQNLSIPAKVVSSTLPLGQGNSRYYRSRTYFARGQIVGDNN